MHKDFNFSITLSTLTFPFLVTALLLAWSGISDQIRSDQSLSRVRLFATPWIAAHQASLSNTKSRSLLRLTSIESAMPSNPLILTVVLICLMMNDVECLFLYLSATWICSLRKCLFKPLVHFWIRLFLLLSCAGSLYSQDTRSLSDTWFENIFSQSVNYFPFLDSVFGHTSFKFWWSPFLFLFLVLLNHCHIQGCKDSLLHIFF